LRTPTAMSAYSLAFPGEYEPRHEPMLATMTTQGLLDDIDPLPQSVGSLQHPMMPFGLDDFQDPWGLSEDSADERVTPQPSSCICWLAFRRCDSCANVLHADEAGPEDAASSVSTTTNNTTELSMSGSLKRPLGTLARFLRPISRRKPGRSRKRGRSHSKARRRFPSPIADEPEAHLDEAQSAYSSEDGDGCSSSRATASNTPVLTSTSAPVVPVAPDEVLGASSSSVTTDGEADAVMPCSDDDSAPASTAPVCSGLLKDRVVLSAQMRTVDIDLVTFVPLYYYASKKAADVHRIRLIRVPETPADELYVSAADLGGVVERKSNISRLFGKYESPGEKLLMDVRNERNQRVGQQFNVVTEQGVLRFLRSGKMKEDVRYGDWIHSVLLPYLRGDISSQKSKKAKL
jgi:hypothetical protein